MINNVEEEKEKKHQPVAAIICCRADGKAMDQAMHNIDDNADTDAIPER